jgi:hypothetical protein
MFRFFAQLYEILIHLIVSTYVKKDNFIFKLDINNANISCNGKGPSTLQVARQCMVVDRRSPKPGDKHIHPHRILCAKLNVFSNTFRIVLYERTVKLNALHAGGIPSCF